MSAEPLVRHFGLAPEPRVGQTAEQAVTDGLDNYRSLYRRDLFRALPRGEPTTYLYDIVADYPTRGGKGLRPSLCLAACGAFGGSTRLAVPLAIAFELLHNAFLIHDDIEDESELRRGQPTAHIKHGAALSLNAGDALMAMSLRPVLDAAPDLGAAMTLTLIGEIEHLLMETVEGQAMELGWREEHRIDLNEVDYLRMILKKTCWYTTIHPLRGGALIAGRPSDEVDGLLDFGISIGSLFQLKDDILNVVGDEDQYGKEIGGDIYEGKRTLLLLHLLRSVDSAERDRIARFFSAPRSARSPADAEWIQTLMHERGSVEEAWSCATTLRQRAERLAWDAFGHLPDTSHRDFLLSMPAYLYESDS